MPLAARPDRPSARDEAGFGLVELMIAMTVLAVGTLAVFGAFLSSETAIRRASENTTAMTIADSRMEPFFSKKHAQLGVTATALAAADSTHTADSAYKAADVDGDTVLNETGEAATIASSTFSPTATVTGADGRSYRVDTYVTWQAVSGGRNVKQTTVVVRRANEPRTLARVVSYFDAASG
jgi:prepilin-type N-terminal cleavage/methylation domain-containing protein